MDIKTFSRDTFYSIKQKYNIPKLEISNTFEDIEKIIKIFIRENALNTNNNNKSWRIQKPKSKIIKENLSEKEMFCNELNCLLNKISPTNFSKINIQILDLCDKNKTKDFDMFEKTIDNIFLKAVMQSTYCPYYVKLINSIIKKDDDVNNIIKTKCDEYQTILEVEDKSELSSTEKETYDEFCDKIKNKTYKAGYSQFIGELYNNNLIEGDILTDFFDIFIKKLNVCLEFDADKDEIENYIICIVNLIKTVYEKIDIKETLITLNGMNDHRNISKRLKYKIMDLYDLVFKDI